MATLLPYMLVESVKYVVHVYVLKVSLWLKNLIGHLVPLPLVSLVGIPQEFNKKLGE